MTIHARVSPSPMTTETYIDLLEVDLFPEHGVLRFFPQLDTERYVRTLDQVAPETPHQDVVLRFFLQL